MDRPPIARAIGPFIVVLLPDNRNDGDKEVLSLYKVRQGLFAVPALTARLFLIGRFHVSDWYNKLNMRKRQPGFTLIELLITILIAAVLLGIGIPSFRATIQNNRLTAHVNEFVTSMNLARSEAVKRGVTIRVTATDSSDGSDEWGPGWSVWIDLDSDNTLDPLEVLRTVSAFGDSTTLDSTTGTGDFRYIADGSLTAAAADTLDLCDSSRSGETGRRITVAAGGRVSLDSEFICP